MGNTIHLPVHSNDRVDYEENWFLHILHYSGFPRYIKMSGFNQPLVLVLSTWIPGIFCVYALGGEFSCIYYTRTLNKLSFLL
jgi:hypothetical protein